MLSSVDLPDPDGPRSATTSPYSIVRSTPESTGTPPTAPSYVFERSTVSMTGVAMLPPPELDPRSLVLLRVASAVQDAERHATADRQLRRRLRFDRRERAVRE